MLRANATKERLGNLNRIGVFTRQLRTNSHIRALINPENIILNPHLKRSRYIDATIGWGMKKKSLQAKKYGERNEIPYFCLEDGFIHSMSQGRLGSISWSLVIDSTGIFYDASRPSDLESLISTTNLSLTERKIVTDEIERITSLNIKKYNNAKRSAPKQLSNINDIILVVDQVEGDLSIDYSLATKHTFQTMLNAAITENPNTPIFIKTHPDVVNSKRRGCIDLNKTLPKNVQVITENTNALLILKRASKVYVVSSQMGLDALLLRKNVICFGVPFYSGWGLTDDRFNQKLDVFKRRKRKADIETLFYAAYHLYSNYINPETHLTCSLKEILDYLELQYNFMDRHNKTLFCIGFTPWKRQFIRHYLKTQENTIFFPKNAQEALQMGFDETSIPCLWSSKHESEVVKLNTKYKIAPWKIEDGFIRSVSLGSNYAPPSSLIIDKTGLYFDPSQTSDLEKILLEHPFDKAIQLEAAQLREQLITQSISKYNVGKRNTGKIASTNNQQRLILIPGQVSDDASIEKGCLDIKTNLDLIKEVRKQRPNDYIIYKPHPDVLSGNREGNIGDKLLSMHCDLVIKDISITECLDQVDEVHTMTSLVGFEALIRGLKVYCYGIPFYSGWGLTTDRHICDRRTRKLNINELTAGTLLLYPVYYNWNTKAFTTPHFVANQIHEHLLQLQEKKLFISTAPPRWSALKKKLSLLKTILKPSIK